MRPKPTRGRAVRPGRGKGRTALRLLLAVIVISGLVAGSVWAAGQARCYVVSMQYFTVKSVQVSGLKYVRREDFISYMGDPAGKSLLSVDLDGMLERVKAHPWMKEVSIKRELPGTVKIEVVERVPAAVANTGTGRFLIDSDGMAVAKVEGPEWDFLPAIAYPGAQDMKLVDAGSAGAMRLAIELLGCVRKDPSERLAGAQVSIERDGQPEIILDGSVVKVGFGGYPEKVRRLSELAREIEKRESRPSLIDLRFPGKVVVSGGRAVQSG